MGKTEATARRSADRAAEGESDTGTAAAPAVVSCPQCGTAMTRRPAPPEREIAKAMIDHNSQHHYAGNYAARVHEKQTAVGVIAQCPLCRYVTRVPEAA
jgi:ssDNA-binding Zn-finger/Zn-ribbon topoisomerase 1